MGAGLDAIIKQANKNAKEEIMTIGLPNYDYEKIPFTSPRMNYITYGGLPLGRLAEFYGEDGGGKTTTALDQVANFQNNYPDREVLYVDAENTLDYEWATKIGVDVTKMVILQPKLQSAEEIFQIILDATNTGEVGMWVLDSIPCLTAEKDLGKDLTDDARVGGVSGILTRFCREVVGPCAKNNCMGIFINQIRDKINSTIPGQINTPGGKAVKHFCTTRMEFRKGSFLDEGGKTLSRSSGEPNSQVITVNMVKTKACKPTRHVGFYTINFDTGIDYLKDLIDLCIKYGIIEQKGAWFTIINPETGEILQDKLQGQGKVYEFLENEENLPILQEIEELLEKTQE